MSVAFHQDGGKAALAGFLYQILGYVGLKASVRCSENYDNGDVMEALIKVVREGRIEHEGSGQDVVIRTISEAGEGLTLVQFKYSRRRPPRPVYRAEYNEIVEKLVASTEQAKADGCFVAGHFLVTNRKVPARSVTGGSGRKRGSTGADSRALGAKNQSLNKRIRRAKSTWKAHREDAVRKSLRILSNLPSDHWSVKLKEFAARYGCEDHEVEAGVDRLVGQVVRGTAEAGERTIEEADLIEAFTRWRTSTALTYRNLQDRSIETVGRFSQLFYRGHLVRQRILDELSREASQRALVILEGPGGTGKSTALADWARSVAKSTPRKIGALTWVLCANETRRGLINHVICECSGLPPVQHERRTNSADLALKRLEIALPDADHPVLVLGLDGVDEDEEFSDQPQAVREILRWFWEEDVRIDRDAILPRATVIVTCRRADEITDNWLNLDASGFVAPSRPPAIIQVRDFTPTELLRAAQLDFVLAYDRIYNSLKSLRRLPATEQNDLIEPLGVGRAVDSAAFVDKEVLDSIFHPAMWRALLDLDSEEVRTKVLDGDPAAIGQLAKSFTHTWFCRRARKRNLGRLCADEIVRVLGEISRGTHGKSEFLEYREDWLMPAKNFASDSEARALYKEAISAGYIHEVESFRWRWRHRLCTQYLMSAQ
jgi:hypothetical protein